MKKFLQSLILDLLNDWRIEQIEIDTEYTDDTGCMFTAIYQDGTEKDGFLSTTGKVTI